MARFSLHKPDIFSKLWRSVKPAAARFPALFVLGLVVAAALTINDARFDLFPEATGKTLHFIEECLERLAWASIWGMLLSVLAQLFLERRFERRVQLAAQAVIFAVSVFALPPLFSLVNETFLFMLLVGVPPALMAGIVFLLMRTQGIDLAIPNCVISAVIAGISYLCVLAGFWIVYFAFTTLVTKLPNTAKNVTEYLLIVLPTFLLLPTIFIAFAARERAQISLPAAYKVIMLRILLPLGIALLAVLYAYLLKCLFTLTMPVGQINPFVSLATGLYLFFYFAALPYESPFLAFFRRYGAMFLAPLVAAQIVAFAIRIDAYGYTPARVASLLYIIFSIVSCALTFVKRGKYMPVSFLIFAALCLLGSATPLNIIRVADRSQTARIMRIYRAHGLLADGVPVAEGAADALTAEEKSAVYEAWCAIEGYPQWMNDGDFKQTFGFTTEEAQHTEKTQAQFYLQTGDDTVIDVSAFSHLKRFSHHKCITNENGIFAKIELNGENIDLTDALAPCIPQEEDIIRSEPLIIPVGGGKTLILTYIDLTSPIKPTDDDKVDCWISGYLCW